MSLIATPGGGQIFALPITGGAPKPVRGGEGRAPRGIEVNGDDIYFTGTNPEDGTPGVYKLAPAGGAAETVYEGAPLIEPEGVAVSRGGEVYVTDRGNTPFTGSVYKIQDGAITRIIETMRGGSPAGLALSLDESQLLVSTLQPYRTRAQVLLVDLKSGETSAMTQAVGQNPGAGGLHRARNGAIYAWCGIGSTRPPGPNYKIMNQ